MIVASYTDDDVFFVTEEQEEESRFLGVRMGYRKDTEWCNQWSIDGIHSCYIFIRQVELQGLLAFMQHLTYWWDPFEYFLKKNNQSIAAKAEEQSMR